ncbi:PREDICTED: uncharacterized protein LOC104799082 [Tarenaya hassleriana]|uniref:uncharacterized protein LOC104799082 n=1 Tax=Tarenaya hassleriana TaxID=28532 RepID=UPI00053C57F6|nr:PREDICTED: uncharacterized protein LOC104799082 [Tarenaya hassleriana]
MSFNMPSNPFVLNSHADEAFVFGAIGNHLVQSNSMLVSSNHKNHDVSGHGKYGNMLNSVKQEPGMVLPSRYFPSSSSSSSSFMCSRNSIPIPSFGPSNQFELGKRMVREMRRNLISTSPPRTRVSSSIDYFPIEDNPHMTRVSITETVTKQLSAVVPTNNIVSVQNDMERVKRALVCESNVWNSPARHASLSQNVHGRTKRTEILRAQPLSIVSPRVHHNRNPYPWHRGKNKLDNLFPRSHKDPVYPGSFNISPSSNHRDIPNNGCQEFHLQANQGKRSREYKKDGDMVEYFFNYSEEDEDNGYDGRTHSLPYEKYGPYTCPKCNNVSDTSQKFAAHMVSVHYKNETSEEKRKRLRARYKKRFGMLHPEMVGVKLDISEHLGARKEVENIDSEVKEEEGTETEDGGSSKGSSNGEGTLYNVVVKQELM